jgi:hypothetical protein
MIMRDGINGGDYEIFDLGGNAIQAAYSLGQLAPASMGSSVPVSAGNIAQIGAETPAQTLLTMSQPG